MKARSLLTVALLSVCVFTSAAQAAKQADGGKKKGPPAPAKLIEKLDADESGTLSKDEVAKNKMLTKRFNKIDANKDGELDLEELKVGLTKKPKNKKQPSEEEDNSDDE